MARVHLGVDVGGTFTDIVAWDEETGTFHLRKVASTPQDPAMGVIAGVTRTLAEAEADPRDVISFVNGTTVAVNTVIQRAGARVGLLVTRGFRDLLSLRRVRLAGAPSYTAHTPEPLVRRTDIREIGERLAADGTVLTPLQLDEVAQAVAALVGRGIDALAICFLHAYRDPRHEAAAKAWVRDAYPDLYVCASSEVWPQQREYERCAATVLNAYVGSTVRAYFDALGDRLGRLGVAGPLLSTKSNGGVMSVESAREAPIQTLLSGPASGVIAARHIADLAGVENVVTLDMGGTSADVSVLSGEISFSTENTVGEFPVILPSVDVTSVGAGGGSLLWVDETGSLRVGPQSAGAAPGPACYGLGGAAATITDCYVVLGIIGPHDFLGGSFQLDPARAEQALAPVAASLGLSVAETAASALDVATATMSAALLPLLAGRGVDRRDFALMPFGGAGPTHAFLLAQEAGFDRVMVPVAPGTLCALGCVLADFRADFVRTVYAGYEDARALLERGVEELDAEAHGWLAQEGIVPADRALVRSADVRYAGQSYELTVPLPPDPVRAAIDALPREFERVYAGVYGYTQPGNRLEVVNLRVQAVGAAEKPAWHPASAESGRPPAPVEWRSVGYGDAGRVPVFRRDALRSGCDFPGPAIVTQYDTTIFIPGGFRITVDRFLNVWGEQTA